VHEGRCCYWLEDLLTLPDEYFFNWQRYQKG
jgi:hypothetical protein